MQPKRNMKTTKGLYNPIHPDKYVGKKYNGQHMIVYRSGLEFKMMYNLDKNPNVIRWSSEEFSINYFSPVDLGWHRYYPDMLVEIQKGDKVETIIIEIKPSSQCKRPTKQKNQQKYLKESMEFCKNQAKWEYAKKFAEKQGWKFKIITELDLKDGRKSPI